MKSKKFILYFILLTLIALTSCSSNVEHEEYSVSGVIRYDYGIAVSDVRLNFSNSSGSARTDSEGKWRKSDLRSIGTVTPAKEGYIFHPSSQIVSGSRDDIDFIAYERFDTEVTQIGRSYHEFDETSILGQLFIDSDENIWLGPRSVIFFENRDMIIRYRLGGSLEYFNVDNLESFIYDNGSVFYTADNGSGQSSIYQLDSENEARFLANLRFEDNSTRQRYIAKNSDYIYSVSHRNDTLYTDSLIIERQNFDGDYKKETLDFDENVFIYGAAVNDNNLFVLKDKLNARFIYTYDVKTLQIKESFTIGSTIGIPSGFFRKGNNFYFTNSSGIIKSFELNSNGEIIAGESSFLESELVSAFPRGDAYIVSTWREDIPGIYKYNTRNEELSVIKNIPLEEDILYETWSVDTYGQKVYISCRQTIKILEDNKYEDVLLDDYFYKFAVNQSGDIAVNTIGNKFILVQGENVIERNIPINGHGIDSYVDNHFIIRSEEGNVVLKYDPHGDKIDELFEFNQEEMPRFSAVAILPNNILALNWNDSVKLYDYSGNLLKQTGRVFDILTEMTYSEYYGQLIILENILLSESANLYFLNTATLEIEKKIPIDEIPGRKTDIAVDENGLIYIASADNSVYKLQLK